MGACVAVFFPGVSGADFRLCGCGMMRVLLVLATLSLAAAHPGDILAKSDFRDGTQDWTLAGASMRGCAPGYWVGVCVWDLCIRVG